MRRRQRLGRALTYLLGILISLWVIIPIWFIASMALTTPAVVRSLPERDPAVYPSVYGNHEILPQFKGNCSGHRK